MIRVQFRIAAVLLSGTVAISSISPTLCQAQAQGNVPLPGSGPSLADTEAFIARKIADEGHIHSIIKVITSENEVLTGTLDNKPDLRFASSCIVSYQQNPRWTNIPNPVDSFSLKDVSEIRIISEQDASLESFREEGHSIRIEVPQSPIYYRVTVNFEQRSASGKRDFSVWFHEKEMAARISKAFSHASIMCGGGNKDPF